MAERGVIDEHIRFTHHGHRRRCRRLSSARNGIVATHFALRRCRRQLEYGDDFGAANRRRFQLPPITAVGQHRDRAHRRPMQCHRAYYRLSPSVNGRDRHILRRRAHFIVYRGAINNESEDVVVRRYAIAAPKSASLASQSPSSELDSNSA